MGHNLKLLVPNTLSNLTTPSWSFLSGKVGIVAHRVVTMKRDKAYKRYYLVESQNPDGAISIIQEEWKESVANSLNPSDSSDGTKTSLPTTGMVQNFYQLKCP